MTVDHRVLPPTAEEIERRFHSLAASSLRPAIRGSLRVLGAVRRFGWDAEGAEMLEQLEPPIILAANHLSHADTPAILDTLPRAIRKRTQVAAALDVFGRSMNGHKRVWRKELLQLVVAAGFHAFAFDRHGPPLRSVRTSAQLMRNGWNLLLYPEGTRSRTGEIGTFKAGVGVLARITGRPVVPIHVTGGDVVQQHGKLIPHPGRVRVRYGEPMWPGADERPTQFTERLEQTVRVMASAPARHEPAAAAEPRPEPRPKPRTEPQPEPVTAADVEEQPA